METSCDYIKFARAIGLVSKVPGFEDELVRWDCDATRVMVA